MSGALAGKVALVTGASRGIGRAIAHKLASAGSDVAVNYYNSADDADKLCAELRAMGRRAFPVQASVGMADSVDEMFAEIARHFDHLDIVVSNAASGVLRPAMDMSLKHWRWCMETNAFALVLLAQRAVPMMHRGGRIIAMSSLGASRAMPDYGFIGASKAALAGTGIGAQEHTCEYRKRRRRGYRRAQSFPQPRGIAGQFRASHACGSGAHAR